jgi:single-stranded-DNA-specific exonuclease
MSDAQIQQLVGTTLILVDAAMTKEEIVKLTDLGIPVINIDHHHVNSDDFVFITSPVTGCEGVIVNNQYPFEPEEQRYLSGAGVVYYVLEALSPGFCTKDEKALVGLSLLSDIRPLENPLAVDFLHTTYTHRSPLIEYLIHATKPDRDYGFGTQTFDRNFIDFTFSPKVNALFRLNKGYEAMAIFEGKFYGSGEELDVYRRIQNAIRDEIINNLSGEEYTNLTYKYVDSKLPLPYAFDITNFVGLACSQMKNFGKTTILFVTENGNIKRGSVRGLCDDVDYLALFRQFGFKAEGHKNAFGVISVDFDRVDVMGLNAEIARLEHGYEGRKYNNRILNVTNLAFFAKSSNSKFADHNNYVRDNARVFLKYEGSSIESHKKGKATEYTVDGVKVMSFEDDLNPHNGLILPVRERGHYVNFYLKRY